MDRVYDKLFSQIYYGIKCYETSSLSNFEEQKDIIQHGRNGIFTKVFGSYRIISDPKKVGMEVTTELDKSTGVVTQSDIDIYDLGFAKINKFPYNYSGLEVKIFHSSLENFENFLNSGFADIRNLMLTYEKKSNLIKVVGTNTIIKPKKKKKYFEKQLKPSFTY